MSTFQQLSVAAVQEKLKQSNISLVDVRDIAAYQQGHLPNAQHLTKENLTDFLQQTDKAKPIIVYCYHGISSQGIAKFLLEQGFTEVYSMIGGFAAWTTQ